MILKAFGLLYDSVSQRLGSSLEGLISAFSKNEPALALASPGILQHDQRKTGGSTLKDLFDGFFWAVPKHRRSKERNRTRRRAVQKMISYNTNLVPCEVCGNLRQTGYLCGHCLVRIRAETEKIQEKMFELLDRREVLPDKENVILYDGEELTESDINKRPVEIKKKRPLWFSKQLTGIKW